MASYAYTYTVTDYYYTNHNGKKVIVSIFFDIACTRTNDDSTTNDVTITGEQVTYSALSAEKTIQQRSDDDYTLTNRSDFTDFDSLTIPDDLVTWIQAHYSDSINLEGLQLRVDALIDG